MGLRALGDSAWIFEAGGDDSLRRLQLILKLLGILERERIPEVTDVVSSFASVAVHFDPADGERVLKWLTHLPPPGTDWEPVKQRVVDVPVEYGGDLATVAASLGRGVEEIISLHSAAEYTVAALGFSPGFPYLLGLPPQLALPRLATPRAVVAGSVAIAGNQAGIYPFTSQAGWHVLGRTARSLFDPFRKEASLLRPGDRVRFVPSSRQKASAKTHPPFSAGSGVEIIEPGAFTTVQDLGRPGYQKLGVSPGGAADPVAARVANRLVGNPEDAAVLECCMSGPVMKCRSGMRIAFTGWAHPQSGCPIEVPAGEVIDLRNHMTSVRGCIAIAGGIDVPIVLGSRATDVRAGFGGLNGRALRAGDIIPLGTQPSGPPPGNWRVGLPRPVGRDRMIELRVLTGMQAPWFAKETTALFATSVYQVSPKSDRMGARLDGPPLHPADPSQMLSQPVVAGSVQVPPDGQPIVLLSERQTIGGYPQIAHVISADLPKLARAWPGTPLRFREVSLDEARTAWSEVQRDLAFLQTGLGFLR